jgi:putative transposase
MMFPLVLDLAADPIHKIPVAVTCRVLGFSKQAFYKWQAAPVSRRDWEDAHLINAAIDIHHDDPEFGYRFIADELAEQGVRASRNRVNRLCSSQRLWSVHSRKRGLHRKPGPPVHDDLVLRDFTAEQPNQLWLTDITEHPTREGKVYCAVVLDAFSRRVVGWSISHNPTAGLTTNALGMAIEQRDASRGTVIHSDHGTQFTAWTFSDRAKKSGLLPSMGSVGDCYDNAMIEAFWSRMQVELLDTRRWKTRVELANAIFEYIEIFHNRRRRHSSLGMLTPIEFELNDINTTTKAA